MFQCPEGQQDRCNTAKVCRRKKSSSRFNAPKGNRTDATSLGSTMSSRYLRRFNAPKGNRTDATNRGFRPAEHSADVSMPRRATGQMQLCPWEPASFLGSKWGLVKPPPFSRKPAWTFDGACFAKRRKQSWKPRTCSALRVHGFFGKPAPVLDPCCIFPSCIVARFFRVCNLFSRSHAKSCSEMRRGCVHETFFCPCAHPRLVLTYPLLQRTRDPFHRKRSPFPCGEGC